MKNFTFDKQLHFYIGGLASLVVMLTSLDYDLSRNLSIGAGAITAIVLGIGKEVKDKIFGGTVERADIFWTIFGGFISILSYELIYTILSTF